jgi:hypothetical protein
MKNLIASLMLAAIAAFPLVGFAQADIKKDPAYLPIDSVLDVKAIPPQVDVNLPGFLIKDALSSMNTTNLGASGTEIADLTKDVKLIRVLVFEGTKSNRTALAKAMKPLQDELDDKWTAIAKVKDEGDKVGVYVKGDASGDSVAGLAVLVHDGDEGDTVIVNVVGHVSLGKIVKFASQSGGLPLGMLKQLGIGGMPSNHGEPKAFGGAANSKMKKNHNDAGTNNLLEATNNAPKDPPTK